MRNSGKNRYRFVIITLVILVRTCVGLLWASGGPLLLLIMQQYGISRGTVSWYASVVSLIMATMAVPVGIMGMRMKAKRLFAIGALLQSASIFAPFCYNFGTLLLTRVLFALGIAISAPIAASIYAEWFTSRELPLVNGLTMCFVTRGNTIAFVATIPMTNALSWQLVLTVYGGISLTCALAWVIWGRDRQRVTTDDPVEIKEPPINIINILNDTSFADFERHVFNTCGTKAIVVKVPATIPIKLGSVMNLCLLSWLEIIDYLGFVDEW